MPNFRFQVYFKPQHALTSVGSIINVAPTHSYLRILNCLQLVKVNTANKQSLKIGESFYLLFVFTGQYIYYDPIRKAIALTKNQNERTLFKILTDQFDWNNRGQIQMGMLFKYRIILAQLNSQFLVHENGTLITNSQYDQKSFVAFQQSIYSPESISYPIKLTSLQNGNTLCYKNLKVCAEKTPTVCQYLLSLEKKENSEFWALKHINSNSYLVNSGKQFIFMKDAPQMLKYFLKIKQYDEKNKYIYFQTQRNQFLTLCRDHSITIGQQALSSILQKQNCSEQLIKSIVVSAWLKAQQNLPLNQNNILYILEECELNFEYFNHTYDEQTVEGIIAEGVLSELDFISKKYSWDLVQTKILNIIKLILRIKKSFIVELFKVYSLYKKIMENDDQIRQIVEGIQLNSNQFQRPQQTLQLVQNLVVNQKYIDVTSLCSVLVVSQLLKTISKNIQYKQFKQFVDFTCSQLLPQIQKLNISVFFTLGIRIIKANSSALFFKTQIMDKLSLNLLEDEQLTLKDKLILVQIFVAQLSPYVYIATQSHTVRLIDHEKKNQNIILTYIQDILPKNCRFEKYENKLIAVSLIPFHLRSKHILEISDCKQYIKYLHQSMSSYNYEEDSAKFIQMCLFSFVEIIDRTIILVSQKSLQYDSITHQLKQRIMKCKKQLQYFLNKQIMSIPVIWNNFKQDKQITAQQEAIFISLLKIYQRINSPQKYLNYYLTTIKTIDEPSAYLNKAISLFLQREHQFYPIQTSQKLLKLIQIGLQQQQLLVIASLIHENNMYQNICYKTEAFYKVMNGLATVSNLHQSKLNFNKMISSLDTRKNQWVFNDHQFVFLKNALVMIGGVVSMPIYNFFQTYIIDVKPKQWTLSYFQLCFTFFQMSPLSLKKSFVLNYQRELKSAHSIQKIPQILLKKDANFIIQYIKLLLEFSIYHSSKDLIYLMIGDELAFSLMEKYSDNYPFIIKILTLMISSRIKKNQYGIITSNPLNVAWLKKGTLFIRKILQNECQSLIKQMETLVLKQFTFALINFLKIRQDILSCTQLLDDEILVIEGTNKMLSFEIVDMVEAVAASKQIEKGMLDNIQWFQNQYKVNVNSIQLAHMSIEDKEEIKSNQNFVYSYMLEVNNSLDQSLDTILTKITLQRLISTLLKVTFHLSFSKNPNWQNLQLILNHLHCVVTKKNYTYLESDLKILYLSMIRLYQNKKLRLVAIIQNVMRKTIWRNGVVQIGNQELVQKQIIDNKSEFNELIYQCINNYMIFSPTYSSTANFFNHHGQDDINWSVSCYISMLRFLLCLCKSLKLKFKQIFSENQIHRKQFIGSLIQLNQQHISELAKDTGDVKLTLIAYEIQLINNMLRGPVIVNIETAIKFKYQNIVSLISLQDLSEDPTRTNTFKIIVQIKKLIAEAILILTPFLKFNDKQIRVIEEGLITYYKSTEKLADNLDKVIQKYTKQHKNKLQVMNFDLALQLFFCLIKIYQKQQKRVIKKMRTDSLKKTRLIKSYNKKFKMLYQIYRIFVDLVAWIARTTYKCCKKTATQIDQAINIFDWQQVTHQQNLKEAFQFFVTKHSSIEVQFGDQIQTIYFLLMRQSKCYNASIRKQLHRRVGYGDRDYRLTRFMQQINHVILRLEIQKSIKQFTQKYKPIQIIIKNRQLWKSMNFLCACLLNLIFLNLSKIPDPDVALYFLRAMSYMFCIFLFIIYFIQNLPLKRKLAQEMAKSDKPQKFKKIKSCLQIFNDKTLWFASIYFLIISISIYQLGVVCILMIDFFVRFKISKKVTEIVTRPIIQLLIIILISAQLAFIFTGYQFFIHAKLQCVNTATCIQYTYQQYLGLYKNNISAQLNLQVTFNDIIDFFFSFFAIMITNSLIISVLLYEKKAKDSKVREWNFKVKQRCFICDTERNTIDRNRNNNKGFFEHIEEEHNLWNYIFYLVYLKNKQEEKLNIVENMILKQWRNNQYGWLPTHFINKFKWI